MMILRSSPASPFGRKIKLAARHLAVMDRISVENTVTGDPGDTIRQQNPLGKIPALILKDGTVLYDSPVILEYLDTLAGAGKIIPSGDTRWPALTLQALADGIMDAAILQMYEKRFRPEEIRSADWVAHQAEKVTRSLDHLEKNVPHTSVDVGTITLACALGYLDFRFAGAWRDTRPVMVNWLAAFDASVPAFAETAPPETA